MGETREWFEDRTIQDVNYKRCGHDNGGSGAGRQRGMPVLRGNRVRRPGTASVLRSDGALGGDMQKICAFNKGTGALHLGAPFSFHFCLPPFDDLTCFSSHVRKSEFAIGSHSILPMPHHTKGAA